MWSKLGGHPGLRQNSLGLLLLPRFRLSFLTVYSATAVAHHYITYSLRACAVTRSPLDCLPRPFALESNRPRQAVEETAHALRL